MQCWINTLTNGTNSMNTVDRLLSNIRVAKTKEEAKRSMFDLAFYTRFTEATSITEFSLMDWGFTIAWLISEGYQTEDFTPKFVKVEW